MTRTKATFTMFWVCLLGGTAYWVAQQALLELGPFTLSAARFVLGGAVLLGLSIASGGRITKEIFIRAVPVGVLFGSAMTCLLFGLGSAKTSVAAFLICSDTFLIPWVDWLLFRGRTSRLTALCLLVGLMGILCLTLTKEFTISRADLWLLASALFWAFYTSVLSPVVRKHPPLQVTCVSHLVAAVIALCAAWSVETVPPALSNGAIAGVLYFALVISAMRFTLFAKAQTVLEPSEIGLLYLFEPLSATIIGVLLLDERLREIQWLGVVLIFFAVTYPSAREYLQSRKKLANA